ncbi:hypothetical protein Slin_4709 [Spirosoma linguale DSM 74]|uniref:Uncharacterized protein n=2 Tax=Spirosoma TaxID=107 RepID=D2QPM8_SPILD|nr:hypothetical protein Slin_4709 [Spirosoma linguale DSM 74]
MSITIMKNSNPANVPFQVWISNSTLSFIDQTSPHGDHWLVSAGDLFGKSVVHDSDTDLGIH